MTLLSSLYAALKLNLIKLKIALEKDYPRTNKDTIYTKSTDRLQNNIQIKHKHPIFSKGIKDIKNNTTQ